MLSHYKVEINPLKGLPGRQSPRKDYYILIVCMSK
jgi:hypothetical protein